MVVPQMGHLLGELVAPSKGSDPGDETLGSGFNRDKLQAKVVYSVQEAVELTLVEQIGHEAGLTAGGFNRDTWKRGKKSGTKAPTNCHGVPP